MVAVPLTRSGRAALLAVLAAALPAALLWDFTVDDALISARYAAHLASGHGYRFNLGGPATDGVTPLGWALLLAPAGGAGPLAALAAAKILGLATWLSAAALLGVAIRRSGDGARRHGALLLLLCSPAMAAWSVAGMETGLVLALGALAAAGAPLGRPRLTATSAGLAAALRPELLPWALALSVASFYWPAAPRRAVLRAGQLPPTMASAGAQQGALGRRALLVALGGGPFALVALTRLWCFGRVAPLAIFAKPSDFAHGWRYAVACLLLAGPLAIVAWRRLDPWCRGMQLAVAAHLLAVAFAGGDWMPLSRLVVPVLPCVVVAAAHVLSRSSAWVGLPRLALAVAGLLFAAWRAGPAAARVGPDRQAVMAELGAPLGVASVVAALDIGWVGASTDATILDLAGVTDPAVAALPGGHTSKQIPPSLFARREVDTIVLLLAQGEPLRTPWTHTRFARIVEHHVARLPSMAEQFHPIAQSHHPRLRYVVLRRRGAALADSAPSLLRHRRHERRTVLGGIDQRHVGPTEALRPLGRP